MKAFLRFFTLPGADRLLIARITWYILRTEIVLRILPYSAERKLVFKQAPLRRLPPDNPLPILRKHLKYLDKVCRNLPWSATCLRQAVALRDSLAKEGVASTLKIGLCRKEGEFAAHAWLECCDHEVLKNGDYSELTPIDGDMHNEK